VVTDTYPTSRSIGGDSVTFGWESLASDSTRDRTAAAPNAPELSGMHQISSGDPLTEAVFRVDLPATGEYSIRIAAGDASNAQTITFQVRDTASALISRSETANSDGDAYFDATGVERVTAAVWRSANVASTQSFATTIFRFANRRPSGGSSCIAHLSIAAVASAQAPRSAVLMNLLRNNN
jgi:hypothetical protein